MEIKVNLHGAKGEIQEREYLIAENTEITLVFDGDIALNNATLDLENGERVHLAFEKLSTAIVPRELIKAGTLKICVCLVNGKKVIHRYLVEPITLYTADDGYHAFPAFDELLSRTDTAETEIKALKTETATLKTEIETLKNAVLQITATVSALAKTIKNL